MEITVTIDSREIRFKKTGGTMRRYKAMCGREWFADLDRIARMQRKAAEVAKAEGYEVDKKKPDTKKKSGKKGEKDAEEELTDQQVFALSAALTQFDSDPYYDMLYCMAKEADPDIPDSVDEWLDTFDDFAFLDVWAKVSPMLSREMSVDAKNG
ncbi:MAG: hypothetical protein IJ060_11900 [Oscillospiraceae bacterium]|nr:hypothetical protein [Oscillospiraceae bacterium]